MLHILWIVIKFILILLAILLGLVVLAILLILFCPVRYKACAVKEGDSFLDASASAKVSWLFGGISFRFDYKNRHSGYELHLFGIPLFRVLNYFKKHKKKRQKTEQRSRSGDQKAACQVSEASVPHESRLPETDLFTDDFTEEEHSEGSSNAAISENQQRLFDKIGNMCYALGRKLRAFYEMLRGFWQKLCGIPGNIRKFTLTIENICDKINMIQDFLEHPRTQAAISLVKEHLIRLFRHVFPAKIQGKLTFGSTDPSITGSVLAVLGMTIPFHRNCIAITPVFEDKNMLEGNISLKGRFYGVFFIKTALELYFNKNIKYVIRRWKHEHKED